MESLAAHFGRALAADPGRVHFVAHSHHLWPDATLDAQVAAWNDAAALADRKWDKVFGEVWPEAQAHVARVLRLPDAKTVAFAPNTHELAMRILSGLPAGRAHRILTTDAEFHSWKRQLARLEEDGLAVVTRVASEPFDTFEERFALAARGDFDLVYLSQVFFNSGFAVQGLARIAGAARPEAVVVVDGYHGFLAMDTDLSAIASRVFYLAGGYKYAMSGEGACFVHAPPGWLPRPRDTGWFADFFALAAAQGGPVPYAADGSRFLGATFDPTALYRFVAAMRWLEAMKVDAAVAHAHAHRMQARFMAALAAAGGQPLRAEDLVVPLSDARRGNFLAFRTPRARELHERLQSANILTDARGDRLRFGFGLYHDDASVDAGSARVAAVLAARG